jgi:class 3 adenylate cyclase
MNTPLSQWLARALNTEYHAVPGEWVHSWRDEYEDQVLDLIEEFIVGSSTVAGGSHQRVLQTLLFTDIVGSTPAATSMGDAEWRNVLDRHDAAIRRRIVQFRGREIKQTGDGILASFDGPARAVECAFAIRDALAPTGLKIRAGIHIGECEVRGDDLTGVAVHIAARVCALADPDEILATSTVRDLVVGSRLQFEDRGTYELKGIDKPWSIVTAVANS